MRSPSVTTATLSAASPSESRGARGARDRSTSPTRPASSAVMYTPCVRIGSLVVGLARLAHSWGVHVGHYLHGVVHEEAIERTRVLLLQQTTKEDVLIDGARGGAEALQGGCAERRGGQGR